MTGDSWPVGSNIVLQRYGRTICKFYKDCDADGRTWWRLHCVPVSAKQWALLRSGSERSQKHLPQPTVWREVIDAHGTRRRRTPVVAKFDIQAGEREIFVFPRPVGRVEGSVVQSILTKYADAHGGREVLFFEFDTLARAIKLA